MAIQEIKINEETDQCCGGGACACQAEKVEAIEAEEGCCGGGACGCK